MKKSMFLLVGIVVFSCMQVYARAESFVKSTYPFSMKDGQTLSLDLYTSAVSNAGERNPCVLFMFGGGFAGGSRDIPKYIPYFDYLVQNGYTVISLDYRLGLKEVSQQKDLSEELLVKAFINAVDMAVEDLFDATRFIIQHADEWNIDPAQIIINGSSAGAVTVLQAEYAVCNGTYNVKEKLPAGFRYAGVISFAGAIFVPDGGLKFLTAPAPLMLLHGDADLQVPYDNQMLGSMGLYGAKAIAQIADWNNLPYYFYHFDNYGHEIASDPMANNKEDVLWFLHTFIRDKKPYQIYKEQKEIGRPEVDKNFGFQDYVKGNFDR